MPVIIKEYDSKTWPKRAEHISAEEVAELEKAGKVEKGADGIYKTRVMTAEKVTKVSEPVKKKTTPRKKAKK
jgi:hypothetical protein